MSWSHWASSSQPSPWWSDREPGLGDVADLSRDLLRAGRERARVTLLAALLFALSAVVAVVALRPAHAPRFVLRVTEPTGDPTTLPQARRQLAEYVREGVLTTEVLLGVMERHDITPTLRRKNPPAAVESFREDIHIEVYQNYFLEARTAADAPRSARLALSYHSKDPEVALAVTRDLGQLVIEREQRTRKLQAERALADADTTLERANLSLAQRRAEVTRKRSALRYLALPDPLAEVQLVSLLGSLEWRERELERSHARKAAVELRSSLESRRMGLSFEVADEGAVPKSATLTPLELCLAGLAAFVAGLPIAAALVGAFESKRGEA